MPENNMSSNTELLTCPIFCYPIKEKPHNIIRSINLFDLFVSGLTMIKSIVELKTHKILFYKLLTLAASLVFFTHSLYMVMYYNKQFSNGTLVAKGKLYCLLRMYPSP